VRPSHEHLTDVARNDWRSQRERTAVFGKGSGKKRHEMRTEAKGGKRRRRNRRSLMPAAIRQPFGARACGPSKWNWIPWIARVNSRQRPLQVKQLGPDSRGFSASRCQKIES